MTTLRTLRHLLLLALLAAAVPAAAQDAGAGPLERLRAYRLGGDQAVLDAVAQWTDAARANPASRRQAARELAAFARSDAPAEARQVACRQLVLVAGEEEVPTLVGLLRDPQLAHYALMVLARIPGATTTQALLAALPQVGGFTALEVIDALGERRDPAALGPLSERLRGPDAPTVRAAAAALGKMGRPAARALRQAYVGASGSLRAPLAEALLVCARQMRAGGDAAGAASVGALLGRAPDPALRAAALRELALAGGVKAVPALLKALAEDGTPRQKMAASVVREIVAPGLAGPLGAGLPGLPVRGRVLLLAALADRGDRAAAPAVLALCAHRDPATRAAAVRALGRLGGPSAVPALLRAASRGAVEEREAARASLAALRGPGVDARLTAAVQAEAPVAAEAVRALGARQATAALPALARLAGSKSPLVSAAALGVLRDMGAPPHLPALLDLFLATPVDSRDAVADTIVEIARRGADDAARTGALRARLGAAAKPADRAGLLTMLGEVGGPSALPPLRASLFDAAPEVCMAALRQLAEWPTEEPVPDLLRVVRSTGDPAQRAIALRGTIRLVTADESRSPDRALALYRELAGLARTADDRKILLAGLARVRSLEALQYAATYLTDEAVRAEAELAVVEIGRATAGAYRDTTRAVVGPIASTSTSDVARARAAEVLALIDKYGDFVTAWEVSPAYEQAGVNYAGLFDIAFAPEQPGHEKDVPWRLMPAGTAEQPWLLDLLALWGGEQRVAYLRTAVWSEAARDLVLELGSDDGVKAWWNGEVVLADNAQRAVAPAQAKVTVHARAGWNALMLKVTQNVMGWGACARFAGADGAPAAGVRCAPPSASEVGGTGGASPAAGG